MQVLGIDPGIARTGWGLVEVENGKLRVESFGCIETSPREETHKRLEKIYLEILKLIKKYSPESIAIEELFFNTNAKTAFVVGQARGVILLACSQKNLNLAVYTPLQVKIAVTGYGRAEKPQVGKMVKTILNLKTVPKPDDTADALAIGLTHLFSIRMKEKS